MHRSSPECTGRAPDKRSGNRVPGMLRRGHSIQSSMPRRDRSRLAGGEKRCQKVAIICTCREYFAGWSTRERNPRRCTKARTGGVVAVVNTPGKVGQREREGGSCRGRSSNDTWTRGRRAFNTYAPSLISSVYRWKRALSFEFMLIYALIGNRVRAITGREVKFGRIRYAIFFFFSIVSIRFASLYFRFR